MYYKGATAGLIVYDISSMESFEGAKRWVKELKNQTGNDITLAIVGNKIDLDSRAVPHQLAKDFSEQNQVLFREVSAK
jgi:GTPase SAR1 family protein